jgi:glucokinase
VIKEMLRGSERIRGIGIGCAGPVDPARGLINNPYTLTGWNGCDIAFPLRDRFGVDVRLENDADAAAMGEYLFGAGRGCDPLVVLTFGTGVGGGVIESGRIYRGTRGQHPELGHLSVSPGGPACYCGTAGCLESLASGSAIGESGKRFGLVDSRAVFAAAEADHGDAVEIIACARAAIAQAAWTIWHTFLPERLLLGGGLMEERYEWFAGPIRSGTQAVTQFDGKSVDVQRAALGNRAGMVGAAALMLG